MSVVRIALVACAFCSQKHPGISDAPLVTDQTIVAWFKNRIFVDFIEVIQLRS